MKKYYKIFSIQLLFVLVFALFSNVAFSFAASGSIEGKVYFENQPNKGVEGVEVKLFDLGDSEGNGTVDRSEKAKATTDANGLYKFTGLGESTYSTEVEQNADVFYKLAKAVAWGGIFAPGGAIFSSMAQAYILYKDWKGGVIYIAGYKIVTLHDGETINQASSPNANIPINFVVVNEMVKTMGEMLNVVAKILSATLSKSTEAINSVLYATKSYVLTKGTQDAWVQVRDIALVLLVMVLIVIAFANAVQYDIQHFGLNRIVPRVILAIILVYSSWLIFLFFFDMSFAIQAQAEGLVMGHQNALAYLGNINFMTMGPVQSAAAIGAFVVAIAVLVVTIVSLIILLVSLVLRIVMLSFLLVISPLAFMMYILPFTNSLYKKWWNEFWKWMFMGPIAVAIIAIGSVIAAPVGTPAPTPMDPGSITSMDVFVRLAILAGTVYYAGTLPKKWGGSIMSGYQNYAKKAWNQTGGALAKWGGTQAVRATGVPEAWKQFRTGVGNKATAKRELRGAKLLAGVPVANKYGKKPELIEASQKRNKIDDIKKLYTARGLTSDKTQLDQITRAGKPEEAMAAFEMLAETEQLDANQLHGLYQTASQLYGQAGLAQADKIVFGLRKKNPQFLTEQSSRAGAAAGASWLQDARTNASGYTPAAGGVYSAGAFDPSKVLASISENDIADVNKDFFKRSTPAVPSRASEIPITESTAPKLKKAQVDSLLAGAAVGPALDAEVATAKSEIAKFIAAQDFTGAYAIANAFKTGGNAPTHGGGPNIVFGSTAGVAAAGGGLQDLTDQQVMHLINKRL